MDKLTRDTEEYQGKIVQAYIWIRIWSDECNSTIPDTTQHIVLYVWQVIHTVNYASSYTFSN